MSEPERKPSFRLSLGDQMRDAPDVSQHLDRSLQIGNANCARNGSEGFTFGPVAGPPALADQERDEDQQSADYQPPTQLR